MLLASAYAMHSTDLGYLPMRGAVLASMRGTDLGFGARFLVMRGTDVGNAAMRQPRRQPPAPVRPLPRSVARLARRFLPHR